MKEAAVLALQQKAVSPVLAAVLPMAPELAKSLVGPICDTIRTCVCKDQIVQQELYKTWAKIAPQCLEQFGAFMTLMGQIVDASKEYDKLTVHQVDLVIDKICSEPNVPFPEKQEAIRAIIQQQYEHHERLVSRIADGPLACGGDTDDRTLLHRNVHAIDLQRLQHSHFTTL